MLIIFRCVIRLYIYWHIFLYLILCTLFYSRLVLGRTQFGIFGGFGWVCNSVLVGEPGFGGVRNSTSKVRSSSKFSLKCLLTLGSWIMGSEFGIFGGLSSTSRVQLNSKQIEVCYFWVRPNTIQDTYVLSKTALTNTKA